MVACSLDCCRAMRFELEMQGTMIWMLGLGTILGAQRFPQSAPNTLLPGIQNGSTLERSLGLPL